MPGSESAGCVMRRKRDLVDVIEQVLADPELTKAAGSVARNHMVHYG